MELSTLVQIHSGAPPLHYSLYPLLPQSSPEWYSDRRSNSRLQVVKDGRRSLFWNHEEPDLKPDPERTSRHMSKFGVERSWLVVLSCLGSQDPILGSPSSTWPLCTWVRPDQELHTKSGSTSGEYEERNCPSWTPFRETKGGRLWPGETGELHTPEGLQRQRRLVPYSETGTSFLLSF